MLSEFLPDKTLENPRPQGKRPYPLTPCLFTPPILGVLLPVSATSYCRCSKPWPQGVKKTMETFCLKPTEETKDQRELMFDSSRSYNK